MIVKFLVVFFKAKRIRTIVHRVVAVVAFQKFGDRKPARSKYVVSHPATILIRTNQRTGTPEGAAHYFRRKARKAAASQLGMNMIHGQPATPHWLREVYQKAPHSGLNPMVVTLNRHFQMPIKFLLKLYEKNLYKSTAVEGQTTVVRHLNG